MNHAGGAARQAGESALWENKCGRAALWGRTKNLDLKSFKNQKSLSLACGLGGCRVRVYTSLYKFQFLIIIKFGKRFIKASIF